MRDHLAELAAFQTKVRAVHAAPAAERMKRAQELIAADGNPPATYTTALALLQLVRDSANTVANWSVALDFARKLPDHFANEPEIQEIRAFAAAQGGDNVQAIAELQTLIALTGPTPERLGLWAAAISASLQAGDQDASPAPIAVRTCELYLPSVGECHEFCLDSNPTGRNITS